MWMDPRRTITLGPLPWRCGVLRETRGLVEHTVPGGINLSGVLCTRVDIVESIDQVIRTPAYCRMTGRGRHGGMTVWCGESAPPLQSVKLFE